jgi:DNA-binding NtrC family response regulator
MPGSMDGLGLAAEVAARHPGTALLLATGYADRDDREPGAAACEILQKPYSGRDLREAVERALAAAGLARGAAGDGDAQRTSPAGT